MVLVDRGFKGKQKNPQPKRGLGGVKYRVVRKPCRWVAVYLKNPPQSSLA